MKKVTDFVIIAASLASVAVAGNVWAANNIPTKKQLNNYEYNSDRTSHLRADKNLRLARFMEKLNLDDSQQKQMQTIKSKYQPQIRDLRQNIRSEREKLAQMMTSQDSYSDLRSQHQKIIGLDQEMHNLRFEVMLEMRDVLTTEQRHQWVESMKEARAKRRGRFR